MKKKITIVSNKLTNTKAAWQIARRNVPIELLKMHPTTNTKAHKTPHLAELVCSNSFQKTALTNAIDLLKEELKIFESLMIKTAMATAMPAGGALAVDRDLFSNYIDRKIRSDPRISIHTTKVTAIPKHSNTRPMIITTGPLTTATLATDIEHRTKKSHLSFFDAISPIVLDESIDRKMLFSQSR